MKLSDYCRPATKEERQSPEYRAEIARWKAEIAEGRGDTERAETHRATEANYRAQIR